MKNTLNKSDNSFDVIIFGPGIAGCATALELLAAGWRVAVIGRGRSKKGIESVPAWVVRQLAALSVGVGSPFSTLKAWWGSDRAAEHPADGAQIVERTAVAGALRERSVAGGACFFESQRCRVSGQPGAWEIQVTLGHGATCSLRSRYLVDASGRASTIGCRLGAQRVHTDELSCISWPVTQPGISGVWTESVYDGWWNLCTKAEQGTLSFFSSLNIIRRLRQEIASRFTETRHLVQLIEPPNGLGQSRDCRSSRLTPCAREGWIAVGDAAMTFQPLSSAGIGKALYDARLAQGVLIGASSAYGYHQVAVFARYLDQLARQYEQERRWPGSPFWSTQRLAR